MVPSGIGNLKKLRPGFLVPIHLNFTTFQALLVIGASCKPGHSRRGSWTEPMRASLSADSSFVADASVAAAASSGPASAPSWTDTALGCLLGFFSSGHLLYSSTRYTSTSSLVPPASYLSQHSRQTRSASSAESPHRHNGTAYLDFLPSGSIMKKKKHRRYLSYRTDVGFFLVGVTSCAALAPAAALAGGLAGAAAPLLVSAVPLLGSFTIAAPAPSPNVFSSEGCLREVLAAEAFADLMRS
mmetsp:Transcript_112319/g.318181  ORF Transcript_112319/g.318181 Transcript_112319/m.318181 type:complete len:242 (-) Transcript_112319:453-1178(-)